jgi:hypothetical protein
MRGRCEDQGHHRQRQRAQPGLQGGQPSCLLQVERVQEQETRERPESTDGNRGRTGERDAAEEAQLEHWIDPARLIDQQGPDRQERQHQLAQSARRRPARSRRVDDRVRHTRQRHHHQQLTNGIHPPGPRRPRLGDESGGEGDRGEADGDVDPEDRPPADRLDDYAADDRAESQADTDDTAPHPDGAGALAGFGEDVGDDGHRDRVEDRGVDGWTILNEISQPARVPGCTAGSRW